MRGETRILLRKLEEIFLQKGKEQAGLRVNEGREIQSYAMRKRLAGRKEKFSPSIPSGDRGSGNPHDDDVLISCYTLLLYPPEWALHPNSK
jgi:hypothetical protein